MPGVVVNTAVRSGPATTGEIISAQAFFVGTSVRGKASEPTLVRNLTEYKKFFGGYVSGNLYAHAQTYFEEGGRRLYIQRAVADDDQHEDLPLFDVALARVDRDVPELAQQAVGDHVVGVVRDQAGELGLDVIAVLLRHLTTTAVL